MHSFWGCRMVQLLCKVTWQFLIKLNIHLPYDAAISLLDIYPKESKPYLYIVLFMNIHSSFIHNIDSSKLETTQMSTNKSVDQYILIQICFCFCTWGLSLANLKMCKIFRNVILQDSWKKNSQVFVMSKTTIESYFVSFLT